MQSESEYRIQVIETFAKLQEKLADLKEHLCYQDDNLPAWFQPPKKLIHVEDLPEREQAFAHISQLEYLSEQEPREILVGAGLIAASEQTLQQVESLNEAKLAFKQAVLALKAQKFNITDPDFSNQFESLLPKRDEKIAQALKRMGMSRLHLKQCYRVIPVLKQRPIRVSWTWANTRAIKRISVEQAITMLEKQGKDKGIEEQTTRARLLAFNEPLAIVQDLAPHLRANIVFRNVLGERERLMVKGPVPIFYPHEAGTLLPEINPPGDKRGRDEKRNVRKDVKLEPEPYLPAIRVHRYAR